MGLTSSSAQNAKPRERPYKLTDERGLALLIQPNGSMLWRLRHYFDGKEKMLALGSYPDVSLAEAREKRDEAKAFGAGQRPVSAIKGIRVVLSA